MSKGNQTFDSNGPEIRVRGNAHQVLEKYLQMARDAGSAGDRVAAENYLQHAEHYYRVIAAQSEGQRPRVGGRELSVADVNVQNVSQGLSAALYSGSASNMGMNGDGEVAGEQAAAAPVANGAYAADGNGRFNTYENTGGRENNRGTTRGPAMNRDAGRESNGMRDSNSRDIGAARDGNGEAQSMPAPTPRRAPRAASAPVMGDEQPDYPAELLPTVAPAAAAPVMQPSLDFVPAEAEPTADGADAPAAPRRGRGRPRGSTNRRPRAAAGADDSEAPAPSAAPAETGD
jgi:hypothetical protein